jgi:hypothetical protein
MAYKKKEIEIRETEVQEPEEIDGVEGTHFDTYTGQTSNLVRQLSFAFIAVIWIYRDIDKSMIIPAAFHLPLFLFILTLILDLSHYLAGSILSHIYGDFKPDWGTGIINILFYGKVVLLLVGGGIFLYRMYSILHLN